MKQYRSKRFLAFVVSIVLFASMVFFTSYTPIEIATGITMICAIYIGAESYRESNTNKEV